MTATTRNWIVATLVALAIVVAGGKLALDQLMPKAEAAELDPVQRDKAVAFLDALDAARFADAEAMLAPGARTALAGGKLEEIWQTLPKQIGERQSRSEPRGEQVGEAKLVTFTLQHAMLSLDARIHFDEAGLIDGFRMVPVSSSAPPSKLADDVRFKESDIKVGDLPATLSMPSGKGPFPAVVLVHGSGPNDRDETIGPNKPFRDIAHGLATQGIAVIRYEKRTKAMPESFSSSSTLHEEVVNDAVAAMSLARSTAGIEPSKVFVAGHSLGGMAAPRIIASAPFAAGAILLAGSSRPLHHIVPEQVRYLALLDGEISADEQTNISTLEQQRDELEAMNTGAPAPETLMLGLSEAYWRDLLAYDPAALAASQTTPMLVLQGDRDYQVTVDGDFARWQAQLAGRSNVIFKRYPALNHLFIAGEGTPNPQEYFTAGTLADEVINDMAAWINEQN